MQSSPMRHYGLHYTTNVARDRLFPGEILLLGGGFPPLEIYSRCHVERRLTPRDPSGVHTLEILSFLGPWIDTIGDVCKTRDN